MWLASILQQLYFISWKERRDSCAVFRNGSETCQEWPSPRSFKFFAFRGLPTSHVKVTAPCRPLLPLRNSGGRLWRRTWRLEGRGRTRMLGCECLHTAPAGICPLGILPEQCLPTVLAASFPQELESGFAHHHLYLGRVQHLCCASTGCNASSVSVLLQSTRQS